MPEGTQGNLHLEIGHVLFLDIVGYSKLLMSEQTAQLHELKEIVRATEQFRSAEAEGKLLRLPTGDGGALVFRTGPEAPVRCALEVSKALRSHPELRVRMGIHSGPVNEVTDLNEQANMAGPGINLAQRVMDCGDAGHILLSKRVADDIDDYPEWRPCLHDLGHCEVKHSVRLHLFNLYADGFGNPAVPARLRHAGRAAKTSAPARWLIAALVTALAVMAGALLWRNVISGSSPRPSASLPRIAAPEKSIAVLPFANLSSDKENAYFADGVQDEILTYLAKVADLRVISRTSVMQYKTGTLRNLREIGQQLGVAHLLEGSVQRAGNKIRVNAQLIDARTDAHQWAQVYDRPLDDVFAIQSEIARAIADKLKAKLSPNEKEAVAQLPTTDVPAFEQYSQAKTLMLSTSAAGGGGATEREYSSAITLLTTAIARDPAFHAAYCLLVNANDQLYSRGYDHTPARLAAAEEALAKASELRPDSPETHLARALHLYVALRDMKNARAEVDFAAQGLPNDPRIPEFKGYILRREGKAEEALAALQQALLLDPRNTFVLQQVAASYWNLRRYAEAAGALDRALQIQPDDLALGVTRAELDFFWHADPEPMCRFVDQIRTERPASVPLVADNWFRCSLAKHDWPTAEQALVALGDDPFWSDTPILLSRTFGEGLLARAMHDEARAQRAFSAARVAQEAAVQNERDYAPALCILGLIDAALGNKEAALKEGRRATELLPASKDAINGPRIVAYYAMIAAWTGEKDLALQQLTTAIDSGAGPGCTYYGMLKAFPFWDPLRGDPRFEKLVSSLAPH